MEALTKVCRYGSITPQLQRNSSDIYRVVVGACLGKEAMAVRGEPLELFQDQVHGSGEEDVGSHSRCDCRVMTRRNVGKADVLQWISNGRSCRVVHMLSNPVINRKQIHGLQHTHQRQLQAQLQNSNDGYSIQPTRFKDFFMRQTEDGIRPRDRGESIEVGRCHRTGDGFIGTVRTSVATHIVGEGETLPQEGIRREHNQGQRAVNFQSREQYLTILQGRLRRGDPCSRKSNLLRHHLQQSVGQRRARGKTPAQEEEGATEHHIRCGHHMAAGDGNPTTQNGDRSGLISCSVLGPTAGRLERGVPSHHLTGTGSAEMTTPPRRICRRFIIVVAVERKGNTNFGAPPSSRGSNHGSSTDFMYVLWCCLLSRDMPMVIVGVIRRRNGRLLCFRVSDRRRTMDGRRTGEKRFD